MKEIFFDESGNTGPDLLNENQPIYILCSTDLTNGESRKILEQSFNLTHEIHFKKKKRSNIGKQQILNFLSSNKQLLSNHCKIEIYHKEFLVTCYMAEYFIEPIFYKAGIDYYDYGMNIAFSNMFYICFKSFCGKANAHVFYEAFIDYFRNNSRDNKERLQQAIEEAKKSCIDEDFCNSVIQLLEQAFSEIDENLSELDGKNIDPSISAFIHLVQSWMVVYQDGLIIKHDESNSMEIQKNEIDFLSKLDGEKVELGYGKFKAQYPLRINKLLFCDSTKSYSIQICDLLSSSFHFSLKELPENANESENKFQKQLQQILLYDFPVQNCIWPDNNVSPREDRKRGFSDINPVDYLAFQYFRQNNM